MIQGFKNMIIDLMLLDKDNAMALLEQYKEINNLNEQDKEYKAILKYIEKYER
jgi:hypothetical protein